jgi:translation elongation factor EF-Tu-like GTPase
MCTDLSFRMTVQDVFTIRGRGTVVTGVIESGTLKVGDEIHLDGRAVVVSGIEMFHQKPKQVGAGENVGLLLRDLSRDDVHPGDVLTA